MELPTLHIDFECRSLLDVREVGPAEYAAHPSTEVTAMACTVECRGTLTKGTLTKGTTWYRGCGRTLGEVFDNNMKRAGITELVKQSLFIIAAHNAAFERSIWNRVLVYRHGFIPHPIENFECSAARAAMLGLPQSLDGLAVALNLSKTKDSEGRALMLETTSPKCVIDSPNLFGEVGPVFEEDVAKFRRVAEYCEGDVDIEIEASHLMGPLTPPERAIWLMDQKINERGITIDRELCAKAAEVTADEIAERCGKLGELTGGYITGPMQHVRFPVWLNEKGVKLKGNRIVSAAKDVVADLLSGDLPPLVREVLEIRRDSAKSSTAKFLRMLGRSEHDGRMRDNLRYHGAFTGRWAGSGAQIQNYPRGSYEEDLLDFLIDCFLNRDGRLIDVMYGDRIAAAPSILRGCLVAAKNKKLLVWDYRQIEARVLPWLAGEAWKVKAFADIDRDPTLPDLYKQAFADSFRTLVEEVTKHQRQAGKVCELALGYQGGPGAFVSMAKIYRVEISEYLDELREKFPDVAAKALKAYNDRGFKSDIPKRTWIAAEIVKINWRARNPRTVKFWHNLENAAIEAMEKGESRVRDIRFVRTDRFLKCVLPSGRALSYFRPSLSYEGKRASLHYWQTKEGRLVRIDTYGGKLAENITQAVARDVMAEGMHRLDLAGFEMLGTVHDEVIAEEDAKHAEYRLDLGKRLLERRPAWAKGLPLSVDSFAARRYRK